MTVIDDLYRLRERPARSGRRLDESTVSLMKPLIDGAEAGIARPYTGVTTDGAVVPDLFPLQRTGISTEPILAAAQTFLARLSHEQQQTACFPIESDRWRRWHNIHPFIMRHGVLLEDLEQAQRDAALEILAATLSAGGLQTARDIMRLNHTIGEMTASWDEYGEWVYWLSIFGTPSAAEPWGWQIDGHHLCLNCFVLGDQVVLTPTFMGSEPVQAPIGIYAGTRVLAAEEQRGLELINGLNAAQRGQAILCPSILTADLPKERQRGNDGRIQAGAFRDNAQIPYEGLPGAALSPVQQSLVLDLARTYVGRLQPARAALQMAAVERHLEATHFAWMGGTGADDVFYYRLHSPVLLIEFDHEAGIAFANDEPTRSHIHTQVRTPNGNDYGRDLLRRHRALHHAAV